MPAITYIGAGTNGATSTTTTTTLTVPYPTTFAAGDFFAMYVGCSTAAFPGTGAAPGFTRQFTNTAGGSSPSQAFFWKFATGTETGNLTVTTPTATSQARIHVFRNVDPNNPFDGSPVVWSSTTSTTNYVLPAQSPSVSGGAYILHAVGNAATGTYSLTGYAETTDVSSPGPNNWVAYITNARANDTSTTQGTRGVTRSGAVRGAAMSVLLRPNLQAVSPPAPSWGAVPNIAYV